MSLMLLFISNNDTKKQLDELEIDTKKNQQLLKNQKEKGEEMNYNVQPDSEFAMNLYTTYLVRNL